MTVIGSQLVNVHSTNWMWINKAALDKAGGKEPTNWDELIALLDKFKEQGITPVAHGGQPWQDATIFDAVVLSFGTDFYKKLSSIWTPKLWEAIR